MGSYGRRGKARKAPRGNSQACVLSRRAVLPGIAGAETNLALQEWPFSASPKNADGSPSLPQGNQAMRDMQLPKFAGLNPPYSTNPDALMSCCH